MALTQDASRPVADGAAHSAAERAHAELRRRILDGRLPPGHRVKETELAAELGLSRTPVRDALSRLTVEGLLDFRPNVGATVAVWSESQIALMFRLRAMLEPFAAEIAAAEITEAEIAEMRGLCAVMEEAARRERPTDLARLAEANGRLHRMIVDATRSDQLIKLVTLALDVPLSQRIFSRYTAEEIARSMRHHREIVDALSRHDPDWAASAMHTHILASIGVARGSKIEPRGALPGATNSNEIARELDISNNFGHEGKRRSEGRDLALMRESRGHRGRVIPKARDSAT